MWFGRALREERRIGERSIVKVTMKMVRRKNNEDDTKTVLPVCVGVRMR